jgi:hypothetical protein
MSYTIISIILHLHPKIYQTKTKKMQNIIKKKEK